MGDVSFWLRRVDATDPAIWARITSMDAKCFDKHDAPALGTNDGTWWIAIDRATKQDAGYCVIKEMKVETGYISRVGVLPRFRGRGLQKQMMRKALDYARTAGWIVVVSDTANNTPSANSFIALGFRLFEPKDPWGLEESLYWRKAITPRVE